MLQPIFYRRIAESIDKHLEDHYIPFVNSRCAQHKVNYKLWVELDDEQKEEIIEFVEKEISNSIAKKMMAKAQRIPFPNIGIFMFSPFKEFRRNYDKDDFETDEEYVTALCEYCIAHRYKPRKIRSDEAAKSFAENLAKRKSDIL